MAVPVDFWKNEQTFNVFRTKACNRLKLDGVCDWRSQCQYSHCIYWPRRSPNKYSYSPDICPKVKKVKNQFGIEQIECTCKDLHCPLAHSQEEVLFHPDIFKTILCEEFEKSLSANSEKEKKRGSKKGGKCHRYYCPFAHGHQELQTSKLPVEQREACLRALEVFPSDTCCKLCATPRSHARNAMPLQHLALPADAQSSYRDALAFKQALALGWPHVALPPPSAMSLWPPQPPAARFPEQPQPNSSTLPSSAFGHSAFPVNPEKTREAGTKSDKTGGKPLSAGYAWPEGSPAFINVDGLFENDDAKRPMPYTRAPPALELPRPALLPAGFLVNGNMHNGAHKSPFNMPTLEWTIPADEAQQAAGQKQLGDKMFAML